MAVVQITLVKDIYGDSGRLAEAIGEIRHVGMCSELDETYATRLGLLTAELPEHRVEDVRRLDCVSAVALRETFVKRC